MTKLIKALFILNYISDPCHSQKTKMADRGFEAPMDIDASTPFITELESSQVTAAIKRKIHTPPSVIIVKSRKHRQPLLQTTTQQTSKNSSSWLEWAAFFFHLTRVSVTWLHYTLQLLLISTAIYSLLSLALSFRSDLHIKAHAHRTLLLQKKEECGRSYESNKCWPLVNRPPALQEKCEEWGECMRMDVDAVVPWSKLIAKTLADTVEGFVEGVSWRTLLFFLSLLAVYLLTGMQRSPSQQPVIRIVQEPNYLSNNQKSIEPSQHKKPLHMLTEK